MPLPENLQELSDHDFLVKFATTATEVVAITGGLDMEELAGRKATYLRALREEFSRRMKVIFAGLPSLWIIDEDEATSEKIPRPEDIDLSEGLMNTFGKREIETAALNLVKFFCERQKWFAFTLRELLDFREMSMSWDEEEAKSPLFGLYGPWFDDGMMDDGWKIAPPYVVFGEDGKFRITNLFIERLRKYSH